jgi:hypothetical protein
MKQVAEAIREIKRRNRRAAHIAIASALWILDTVKPRGMGIVKRPLEEAKNILERASNPAAPNLDRFFIDKMNQALDKLRKTIENLKKISAWRWRAI